MKMFLDDVRDPDDVYGGRRAFARPSEDWVVARDYGEFEVLIEDWMGSEDDSLVISFDHDLEPERSGLDCAKMLSRAGVVPDAWRVHSSNPAGAENIRSFMDSWEEFASENTQERAMRSLTWYNQHIGLYED